MQCTTQYYYTQRSKCRQRVGMIFPVKGKQESIHFNKSIIYRAPCAEYIRCRHFDDDGVFFVRDIRVAERVVRGAGLRARPSVVG